MRKDAKSRSLLALIRAGDALHWRALPVVPRFRRPPEGFVPALATTWMAPVWYRHGAIGYNFWTMALPGKAGESSGRYDPDHPLFQAWVCVYLVRGIPRKDPPFGFTHNLEPVPAKFAALGEADQRAWLWVKGAGWAPARVRKEFEREGATVGEITTRLVRSKMSTHADVGPDNPSPSPLRVDFRPPHAWPPELTQRFFVPQEGQWRRKIHPYQPLEYTVEGYPIPLLERGLSAYFFYAGVRYEHGGRVVDNFDNVREAAGSVLEEGIEFVERRGGVPKPSARRVV
ncbi:hypothetical protein [Rubrobacter radiotolerans]|uniref:Uncharacterized protein n=1 Tax=Rubrobacter radiotolerans TaxID=42256 RepID=A0AB35T755_RUBRA|nr:hypothetical protein [Rubrobacter radiotolerans]MDX5895303.1 hypothetical protein [Rubrobacter radiotolerans]SMC01608.1 hypothetical protein SAMN00767673_2849 [Rubrobacter radiotolerans DSM 5868]